MDSSIDPTTLAVRAMRRLGCRSFAPASGGSDPQRPVLECKCDRTWHVPGMGRILDLRDSRWQMKFIMDIQDRGLPLLLSKDPFGGYLVMVGGRHWNGPRQSWLVVAAWLSTGPAPEQAVTGIPHSAGSLSEWAGRTVPV